MPTLREKTTSWHQVLLLGLLSLSGAPHSHAENQDDALAPAADAQTPELPAKSPIPSSDSPITSARPQTPADAAAAASSTQDFPIRAPVTPPEWQRLGLLRVRDMTPFGLSRLDFLPAHAVAARPGTFAIETNLSYQNTWVRSANVRDLINNRGTSRAPISQQEIDTLFDLPGDAYLVDGEYGLVDLTLHYRATRHLGLYATIPYFFFESGILDSGIEEFHNRFGFNNNGRQNLPRNQWLMIMELNDARVAMTTPPGDGFGDPVFGLRYALKAEPKKWNVIAETAVKIPRGSQRMFVTTGKSDYGVQLSAQRFFARHALYATASGVYYASPYPAIIKDQWIPTLILGWERQFHHGTAIVLQLYGSRSTVQETNLEELSSDKVQATFGVQWVHRGYVLRFGLTENLVNFSNTPDIGLTLSIGKIFAPGQLNGSLRARRDKH